MELSDREILLARRVGRAGIMMQIQKPWQQLLDNQKGKPPIRARKSGKDDNEGRERYLFNHYLLLHFIISGG